MKTAGFLREFDTILFDMDGVITSERTYWDCAALSSVELAFDERYFGSRKLDLQNRYTYSRLCILRDGHHCAAENLGVNTNWDLAYLMLAGKLGLQCGEDYSKIYNHYRGMGLQVPELYTMRSSYCKGRCQSGMGRGWEKCGPWCRSRLMNGIVGAKNFKSSMGMRHPIAIRRLCSKENCRCIR